MHQGDDWPPRDPEKLAETAGASIRAPERRRRMSDATRRRTKMKRRRAATRYAMPFSPEGVETVDCRAEASSPPAPPSQRATAGLPGAVKIAAALAWSDMRRRYLHSVLGPFWMPVRMAIIVAVLGALCGHFSNGDAVSRLPMLALNLTAWMFLNGVILDATTALRGSAPLIKDRALPPVIFLLECMFRHALFALHNACVPLVLWLFLTPLDVTGIVPALPGFILFIACTLGLSLVIGTLATRFRDVRPIVKSTLALAFVSSPVIWSPDMIGQDSTITGFNPLTHLFAVWREPLAAGHVAMTSEIYVLACSAALALASAVTLVHLRRAAFWI
jgi:ABC-type polysaccharide/polyol phosphate export permease